MYQVKINDEVQTHVWDEETQQTVEKSAEEVEQERQAALDAKTAEVQAKVDAYKAAQQYQIQHGGPGPVADFEIMKITNEHGGEFEVVFRGSGE
jgi:hypothetical protein